MGISEDGNKKEKENKNAHKLVQRNKKEEDMTHGVDISRWKVENTLFSLWDFAGKKKKKIN